MQPLLVVLDLDETLVFASESPLERRPAFSCGRYLVYPRPGLHRFLSGLPDLFDVAVWTSSGSEYANCVVRNVFPQQYPLKFVWTAVRCTQRCDPETRQPYVIKNLLKVKRKGYDLKRVISVDDTSEKYEKNYGNLIRVHEYRGDPEDDELARLF